MCTTVPEFIKCCIRVKSILDRFLSIVLLVCLKYIYITGSNQFEILVWIGSICLGGRGLTDSSTD